MTVARFPLLIDPIYDYFFQSMELSLYIMLIPFNCNPLRHLLHSVAVYIYLPNSRALRFNCCAEDEI